MRKAPLVALDASVAKFMRPRSLAPDSIFLLTVARYIFTRQRDCLVFHELDYAEPFSAWREPIHPRAFPREIFISREK